MRTFFFVAGMLGAGVFGTIVLETSVLGTGAAIAGTPSALRVTDQEDADLVLVAEGCGNGYHVSRYGYGCVATRHVPVGYDGTCPRHYHLGNHAEWCWYDW